jgi:hypothetical protein
MDVVARRISTTSTQPQEEAFSPEKTDIEAFHGLFLSPESGTLHNTARLNPPYRLQQPTHERVFFQSPPPTRTVTIPENPRSRIGVVFFCGREHFAHQRPEDAHLPPTGSPRKYVVRRAAFGIADINFPRGSQFRAWSSLHRGTHPVNKPVASHISFLSREGRRRPPPPRNREYSTRRRRKCDVSPARETKKLPSQVLSCEKFSVHEQ